MKHEAAHVRFLSHLMPVPICFFVATFDPTVERAQNGGERRTEFVRRSLHHGQVTCALSRFIVSRRARTGKRTASRPRGGRTAQRGYEAVVRSARHRLNARVRTPLLSVALPDLGLAAPRCFSEGDDGVLAWSWRVDEALDIGIFQYLPGTKKALHLCKALIFLVFLAPRPGLEPGTYGLTEQHTVRLRVRKPKISNAFLEGH